MCGNGFVPEGSESVEEVVFPPLLDDLLFYFGVVILVHALFEIEEFVEMFVNFLSVGLPAQIQIFTGWLKEGGQIVLVVVGEDFFGVRYEEGSLLLFGGLWAFNAFVRLGEIEGVRFVGTVDGAELLFGHVLFLLWVCVHQFSQVAKQVPLLHCHKLFSD